MQNLHHVRVKAHRRKRIILLACGIFALAVLGQLLRDREPSYQGRTLSEWVDEMQDGIYVSTAAAPTAIRHIGTNAIPPILKWIRYEASPLRTRIAMLLGRLRLKPNFIQYPEKRADHAEMVFAILGSEARAAIPELTCLVLTSSDYRRSDRCINSLSYVGPEALPSLIGLVSNSPPRTRAVAISRLSKFHDQAGVFVPVLTQCLHDQDRIVAVEALETLGRLRVERSVVFPSLTNALHSPSAELRMLAIRNIQSIKSPASEAVPVLIPLLADTAFPVRNAASNALFKIAPEVFTSPLAN